MPSNLVEENRSDSGVATEFAWNYREDQKRILERVPG